jgi:hypothetical protein
MARPGCRSRCRLHQPFGSATATTAGQRRGRPPGRRTQVDGDGVGVEVRRPDAALHRVMAV